MPTLLPSLDDVHKEILSWNYYLLETEDRRLAKAPAEVRDIKKVPLTFSSVDDYVEIFEPLLLEECKAQIVRAKEEAGEPQNLILAGGEKIGEFLFVRFELPWDSTHRYSTGDLILLSKEHPNQLQKLHILGMVEAESSQLLELRFCLKKMDERIHAVASALSFKSTWWIASLCNLVTINREYQALHSVRDLPIVGSILNPKGALSSGASAPLHIPTLMFNQLNQNYNSSQLDAMEAALKRKGFTLIQGPPGTGKTKTILGLLSVLLNSTTVKTRSVGERFSFHGEDSSSSDEEEMNEEMFTRHMHRWSKAMPWLKPAYQPPPPAYANRISASTREVDHYPTAETTDAVIGLCTGGKGERPRHILVSAPSNAAIDEIVIRLIGTGLYNADGILYVPSVVRVGPNFHPSLRNVALDALMTARLSAGTGDANPDHVRLQILNEASIVCTTLSGSGAAILSQLSHPFDTVLLDEAGQAVELSTLIPLKYGCERCIMVGDPNQLPATVFSRVAATFMYERSMFKRFQECGFKVWMLKTQYRMHPAISAFPAKEFYAGQLDDGPDVEVRNTQAWHVYKCFGPYVFYDLSGHEKTSATSSIFNRREAVFATTIFAGLASVCDDPNLARRVGIVTPYKQQVTELRRQFTTVFGSAIADQVDINSVDGFQGREKDIIIFSCVRSHKHKGIGFLSDVRRMNVGITRSRQALFVVGNSMSLIKNPLWEKLVLDAKEREKYIRVQGQLKGFIPKMIVEEQARLVALGITAPVSSESALLAATTSQESVADVKDVAMAVQTTLPVAQGDKTAKAAAPPPAEEEDDWVEGGDMPMDDDEDAMDAAADEGGD